MNKYFCILLLMLLSVNSSSEDFGTPKDDLTASINALGSFIGDSYSSIYKTKIIDITENRKVVIFNSGGYSQGNNAYQFLAVFKKQQKSKEVKPEVYEPFGDVHYQLIGYLQIGGSHVGGFSAEKFTIENNILHVPITHDSSNLVMINGKYLNKSVDSVSIEINEFGLSVLNL